MIERIRQIYLDNEIFQYIIKIKKINFKRISTNLTKKNVKLKLKNCEISDELFQIKNKLYVLDDKFLQITLIKYIYKLSFENYINRVVIYNRINIHYY